MPGLYRSPGLADIDVCFGKREAGTEALKRTSLRHREQSAALEDLLQRPRRSVTLPLPGAYQEDEDEGVEDVWSEEGRRGEEEQRARDVDMSEGSMHEGYGEKRPEETGLPPTPTEGMSSDEPQEPQPMFADGVRNALNSQKSGALSTTPVNNPQLSPPTPDTTPPQRHGASRQRSDPPEVAMADSAPEQQESAQLARPPLETFQTAREILPVQQDDEQQQQGQVYLPDSDRLPSHWLDDTENKPDLNGALNRVTDAGEPPAVDTTHQTDRSISPTPPRPRYRFESPRFERAEPDWDKHISYVSGPDQLEVRGAHDGAADMEQGRDEPLAGLGVSGLEMEQRQRSAEDINNSVYKQIQQDNIRRESAISTNSGAIRAGILLPSVGSTPKSVRRRAKCSSLRDGPASEGGRRHSDDTAEHALKHEKRHLPPRKGLQESPMLVRKRGADGLLPSSAADTRQVSSPARLGTHSSKVAKMTLASKLAASAERYPTLDGTHMMKRQSHGDRLSKNMSIRRTSQEVSPSDLEEAFNRIDRGAASVRKQRIPSQQRAKMDSLQSTDHQTPPPERQSQMNQGVKRSKIPSSDAPVQLRPRKVDNSLPREPEAPSSPRQVRRFSREERLENNEQLRRLGDEQPRDVGSNDMPGQQRQLSTDSTTRTFSHDPSLLSSPRKSLDARFLHPTTTPMSTSGFSDRTADIEVCEASGVRIYPHNNNSLLVVQQGSRPASKDTKTPDGPTLADFKPDAEPIFAAQVDPPTPILGSSNPGAHVDSPLTNPRAAPEPPSIQFIPPTPSEELERELGDDPRDEGTLTGQLNLPGRNLSFKQRVRRYSDSFFGRSSSYRKAPRQLPPRDTHLSPMWRPQRFWDDDYDSEDDYYDDYDYEPESDMLPPGGDTSHFDDDETERNGTKKRPLFPRAMSKRLPGFRGKGGFLQGNSLGIDRHGTNNRRHYVSSGSRTLSKRQSEELLQSSGVNATQPLSRSRSQELPLRQQGFKVPFSNGMRAKWVGTQAFRAKMREARRAREEREREKRREELKGRIGMRVFHG